MYHPNNSTCIDVTVLLAEKNDWTLYLDVKITFGLLYTTIFVSGLVGNVCVVMSVVQKASLRSVQNIFIVNLSCSDLAVCMWSVLITPIALFSRVWIFGRWLCKIVILMQGTSVFVCTLTLGCIAFDRYLCICRPGKKSITRNQVSYVALTCSKK